jgi:hypothetical protein
MAATEEVCNFLNLRILKFVVVVGYFIKLRLYTLIGNKQCTLQTQTLLLLILMI